MGIKQMPPWLEEVAHIPRFMRTLEGLRDAGICSDGFLELVRQGGAYTIKGIQTIHSSQYFVIRRLDALNRHNTNALDKHQHLTRSWGAKERPECVLCRQTGFATRQMSWVAMRCQAGHIRAKTLQAAILAEIAEQKTQACAWIEQS